jgi:DnaJ-class molecular chaperone
MEYKDYYKILGVEKSADEKAIKQAYRRLARKYHPDVNKSKRTAERFKEINEAHTVLSDAEKRQRYDSLGPDWQRYAQGGWQTTGSPFGRGGRIDLGNLGGFSDFFRTFFGDLGIQTEFDDFGAGFGRSQRTASRPTSGVNLEAEVEISLEEAYHGARRTVISNDGRRLEVKIPAGVRDGSRVRVAGEGGPGDGGAPRGDMYLTVRVRPHPLFELKHDDLYLDLPITVSEAALGAEVEVPTFKGKVSMKIPPETSSGKTFRLPQYGMPRLKGQGAGDQYVKVKIVIPTNMSEREKKLLEELRLLRKDNPRVHLG